MSTSPVPYDANTIAQLFQPGGHIAGLLALLTSPETPAAERLAGIQALAAELREHPEVLREPVPDDTAPATYPTYSRATTVLSAVLHALTEMPSRDVALTERALRTSHKDLADYLESIIDAVSEEHAQSEMAQELRRVANEIEAITRGEKRFAELVIPRILKSAYSGNPASHMSAVHRAVAVMGSDEDLWKQFGLDVIQEARHIYYAPVPQGQKQRYPKEIRVGMSRDYGDALLVLQIKLAGQMQRLAQKHKGAADEQAWVEAAKAAREQVRGLARQMREAHASGWNTDAVFRTGFFDAVALMGDDYPPDLFYAALDALMPSDALFWEKLAESDWAAKHAGYLIPKLHSKGRLLLVGNHAYNASLRIMERALDDDPSLLNQKDVRSSIIGLSSYFLPDDEARQRQIKLFARLASHPRGKKEVVAAIREGKPNLVQFVASNADKLLTAPYRSFDAVREAWRQISNSSSLYWKRSPHVARQRLGIEVENFLALVRKQAPRTAEAFLKGIKDEKTLLLIMRRLQEKGEGDALNPLLDDVETITWMREAITPEQQMLAKDGAIIMCTDDMETKLADLRDAVQDAQSTKHLPSKMSDVGNKTFSWLLSINDFPCQQAMSPQVVRSVLHELGELVALDAPYALLRSENISVLRNIVMQQTGGNPDVAEAALDWVLIAMKTQASMGAPHASDDEDTQAQRRRIRERGVGPNVLNEQAIDNLTEIAKQTREPAAALTEFLLYLQEYWDEHGVKRTPQHHLIIAALREYAEEAIEAYNPANTPPECVDVEKKAALMLVRTPARRLPRKAKTSPALTQLLEKMRRDDNGDSECPNRNPLSKLLVPLISSRARLASDDETGDNANADTGQQSNGNSPATSSLDGGDVVACIASE